MSATHNTFGAIAVRLTLPRTAPTRPRLRISWTRTHCGTTDLAGLVHHTDRGSQGGFNRSTQHLNRMRCSDGSTSGVDDDGDGQVGDAFAWTSSAAA